MSITTIPFANPHAAYAQRRQEILDAIASTLDSGWYILGATLEKFEADFAAYLGTKHFVGCANGTDAIELALRALGIGAGKAVFTVSHTAVATISAIERAGAVPVLVDINPYTYTMCSESLEQAIQHIMLQHPELVPAAVIPVHIYGHPCDMDAVQSVALRYNLTVIEDCAQAHGAQYNGNTVGCFGTLAAFSFYPTKNLGALGDAGGVATNKAALYAELCATRQYGWKDRYISATAGINSRMDPVQAAILQVQLKYLHEDTSSRIAIAEEYTNALQNLGITVPHTASWAKHVFHLYVILCPEREKLMQYLRERGISTAIHYPAPVHVQPAYLGRILSASEGLPVTEGIASQILSLPMFPQLAKHDVERVCTVIQEWAKAGA